MKVRTCLTCQRDWMNDGFKTKWSKVCSTLLPLQQQRASRCASFPLMSQFSSCYKLGDSVHFWVNIFSVWLQQPSSCSLKLKQFKGKKNWPNSPLIIRMELMKPFEIFLWSCLLLHCIEVNAIFVLFVKYYIVVISMWDLAESLNGQKPQLVFFFLWVGTVSPVFGLFLRFGSLLSVPMRADDVIPFAWLVGWFLCK